jgi:hypothetical protein
MNKFTQFLKTSLLDPFVRSFFRFTETVIASIVLIVLTIVSNQTGNRIIFNPILRAVWLLLPCLILVTLAAERFQLRKLWKYLMVVTALVIVVAYYFASRFEPEQSIEMMRFAALLGMSSFLALCVPYFPRREHFSTYTMFLASKLFATIFYAGVLYGSLVAIFASVESLFDINFGQYIYMNLLIVIVGLVAIPIFLGFIPAYDYQMVPSDYNKIWKTVFSFIIVPFVSIFSIILLIYIVTSTFNQNYYPDVFIIATIGVGIIGLAALFALEPFIKETPHLAFFRKYWPYLFGAILIGYIIEVIREIIEFGFTMGNTASIYVGIWLIAMTIMKIIDKNLFKIANGQTLFLSSIDTLFLILLFPFINVVNIATYQYNADIKAVLTKYDMLESGVILSRTDLTLEQQSEIARVVSRAEEVGYQRIHYLPDGYSYMDFETVFGFPPYVIDNGDDPYLYISTYLETPFINLAELPTFDRFYDFRYLPTPEDSTETFIISVTNGVYSINDDGFPFTFDLTPVAITINEMPGNPEPPFSLEDLTFTQTYETMELTIYVRELSGRLFTDSQQFSPSSASLLIGLTLI